MPENTFIHEFYLDVCLHNDPRTGHPQVWFQEIPTATSKFGDNIRYLVKVELPLPPGLEHDSEVVAESAGEVVAESDA